MRNGCNSRHWSRWRNREHDLASILCARFSMRSFICSALAALGVCCRMSFLAGRLSTTASATGVKRASGSRFTRCCVSRFVYALAVKRHQAPRSSDSQSLKATNRSGPERGYEERQEGQWPQAPYPYRYQGISVQSTGARRECHRPRWREAVVVIGRMPIPVAAAPMGGYGLLQCAHRLDQTTSRMVG